MVGRNVWLGAAVAVFVGLGCEKTPEVRSVKVLPAEMQGATQVVVVRVTDNGYVPNGIQLKVGVPARVIFKQESKGACGAQVHVPTFGVKKTDLPYDKETAIEFTPDKTGAFSWHCGMDMMKGTIIVKG